MKTIVWTVGGITAAYAGTLLGVIDAPAGIGLATIATVSGLYGALRQDREARPFVMLVDEATWTRDVNNTCMIVVPASVHRKGRHATGEFAMAGQNGAFETALVFIQQQPNGDVVVKVDIKPFAGRLVIR